MLARYVTGVRRRRISVTFLIQPVNLVWMVNGFSRERSKQKMRKENDKQKKTLRSEHRARDFSRIHVRVNQQEHDQIMLNANNTGLNPVSLLRQLGLGYTPISTLDAQHIRELIHLRGDLGRLGGLFKAWLFSDESKPGPSTKEVRKILSDIGVLKNQIKHIVETIDSNT